MTVELIPFFSTIQKFLLSYQNYTIQEYSVQIWDHIIRRKVLKLTESEKTSLIDNYGSGTYKRPRQSSKVSKGKHTPFYVKIWKIMVYIYMY